MSDPRKLETESAHVQEDFHKRTLRFLRDLPYHRGGMLDCKKAWDNHAPDIVAAYEQLLNKPHTPKMGGRDGHIPDHVREPEEP